MIKKWLLIVFSAALLCLGVLSVPTYAAEPTEVQDPCKLHESEFQELCKKGSETDAKVKVGKILNVVYGLIGVVAVVFVIIGGFKYMTSQGEPGRVQQAKNTIMYALIGLIITVSAFAITAFILQALGA